MPPDTVGETRPTVRTNRKRQLQRPDIDDHRRRSRPGWTRLLGLELGEESRESRRLSLIRRRCHPSADRSEPVARRSDDHVVPSGICFEGFESLLFDGHTPSGSIAVPQCE